MGFKKVYLLGFSFNDKALSNHWYDDLEIVPFENPDFSDPVDKLKNTERHNAFFDNALIRIDIVGVTKDAPSKSYFKWILYEDLFKTKPYLVPRSPYEMTDYHNIIEYHKLERLSFNNTNTKQEQNKSK
jgi:hypothetical protein